MESLVNRIIKLKEEDVSEVIRGRIREFENVENIFHELCFCLMTANFQAEKSIFIQKEIGEGFVTLSKENLAIRLKELGHRFWPQRAECIFVARNLNLNKEWSKESRQWLIENVKGFGMKESSHFLRNIGVKDIAIIDFHIVDLLVAEGLIQRPKSLSREKYLEIEDVLIGLANKVNLSLAELDLYLWYIETGKVLK